MSLQSSRDGMNGTPSSHCHPVAPTSSGGADEDDDDNEGNDNDELLDITTLIEKCASALTIRETFVCNKASFNLHDSMAATELADRKMDCCEIPATNYVENSDTNKVVFPRPVPDGLEDPFAPLPWEKLIVRESAYIALQLLVCFQAFLAGSSAGESTFTCLYAHAPVLADMKTRLFGRKSLVEPIDPLSPDRYAQFLLFTCAVAVVDATDVVRGIVVNADIYEEEDFSPNTYDIPFYTEREDVATLRLIETALRMTTEAQVEDPKQLELNLCILGFLFGFLSVCGSLGKLTTKSLRTDVESLQQVCRLAVRRLEQLEEALTAVAFEGDESLNRLLRQTFDPYVNRPLVGNTPVRKPFSRTTGEAIRFLHTLTTELDWAVCDLLIRGSSLGRVQRMLDRVQRSDVNILSRSLIILNLYFDEKLLGQYSLVQLISDNMCQWRDIPDAFMDHEHTITFVERLAKPIYDTLKLRTLNRCRQRAYIELVMLNDWIALHSEARMVDVHYREHVQENSIPPFLTQYILTFLVRIMDRHIAVGLELEIFRSQLDISMAYWYRDFLLSALLNSLSTMRGTRSPVKDPSADKSRSKKNMKAKQRAAFKQQQEVYAEQQEDSFEMMLISVQRDLCRGLKRFLAALNQSGVATMPTYQFTSPERIFEERFEVFALVPQPPPLTYQDYIHGSDYSNITEDDLLTTTANCFQNSKNTVERMLHDVRQLDAAYASLQEAELRGLLKVCVGNAVYLLKLRSLIDSKTASDAKMTFAFEGKSQFCTVKLS